MCKIITEEVVELIIAKWNESLFSVLSGRITNQYNIYMRTIAYHIMNHDEVREALENSCTTAATTTTTTAVWIYNNHKNGNNNGNECQQDTGVCAWSLWHWDDDNDKAGVV